MEVYLSPEWMSEHTQILNIVNDKQKAVGFLFILNENKKMYVFGHLQEIGLKEDYRDLITPYIQGMAKSHQDLEVFSYLTVGGEMLDIKNQETD